MASLFSSFDLSGDGSADRIFRILLFGGTSDSLDVLHRLTEKGLSVVVSLATDTPMNFPDSPLVMVRRGPLDLPGMITIIKKHRVTLIIDATHPYATQVTANARKASSETGIPFFRLQRAASVDSKAGVIFAKDHADAAQKAADLGGPVLLTIGVKHLAVYASVCRKRACALVVRTLPNPKTLELAKQLGIPEKHIIMGFGPFTYSDNIAAIRKFGVRTLVTKDSGIQGGTDQKIKAAQAEGCQIIVVQRPAIDEAGAYSDPQALVEAVHTCLRSVLAGDGRK